MNPTHPSAWGPFDAPADAARLASRAALLAAAGWLCLLAAVAAPPLLCSGSVLYGPEYVLTPVGLLATVGGIIAPVTLGGLWWLVRFHRQRHGRRLALARIAEERGWALRESPAAPQRVFLGTSFQLVASDADVGGLIWSRDRRPRIALDVRLASGPVTAFIIPGVVPEVPGLILQPRGGVERLMGVGQGVEVPGQPGFNRDYALLTSLDAIRAATACVTDAVGRFCLDEKDVVVEVRDGHLLVFWRRGPIAADDFNERLARVEAVAKLLRRG